MLLHIDTILDFYRLYCKHILLLIVSSELQYQQTTKRKVKETIVELQSNSLSM